MGDVTQILSAIEGGDAQAADKLLPLIYDELRRLAAQRNWMQSVSAEQLFGRNSYRTSRQFSLLHGIISWIL